MINRALENEIYNFFKDDIDVDSFKCEPNLLKTLIYYKCKASLSYLYEETPISLHITTNSEERLDEYRNCIIINGAPFMDEKYFGKQSELCTAFINNNIKGTFKYKIYLNEDTKCVHLIKLNENGEPIYDSYIENFICAILTSLLPWHLKDNIDNPEIFRELAPCFTDAPNNLALDIKFEEAINELGIIDEINENKLLKLGETIVNRKKESLENDLKLKMTQYESTRNSIYELKNIIENLQNQIFAIEFSKEKLENPVKEIFDFIKNTNENIKIKEINENDEIVFEIISPIEEVNMEEYETVIKNNSGNSDFFDQNEDSINHVKTLFSEIFESRNIKVWASASIYLNLTTGQIYSEDSAARIDDREYMCHPHLNSSINCFGTAGNVIIDFTLANRFVEALNAILYASRQFTIVDSYARDIFLQGIRSRACIELPDGTFTNMGGAVDYIAENKKEESE